jgi:hypothetical protein
VTPRVSVIVPAYQAADTIADTLDSLFASDYPTDSIQTIVVDDGSTDDLQERLAPFRDRIEAVRKPNGGLVSAINHGLREANGDYIAFLDADDMLHPAKLAKQVEHLERHSRHGLVYCDLEVIDERGETLHPSWFALHEVPARDGWVFGDLLEQNFISAAQMVRASLRERFDPVVECAPCQDWPIALRIAERAPVGLVREPLYRYRQHGGNMNLGADEQTKLHLLVPEIAYRRWTLRQLDTAAATPEQLNGALGVLEWQVAHVARRLGRTPESLFPVTKDDTAEARHRCARGDDALTAGDPERALREYIAALACDCWHRPARIGAGDALRRLNAGGGEADAIVAVREALATAHPVRVLAFAEELLADPELLAGYASAFSADDPVTLVVYAEDPADEERLGRELLALVERLGLDGPAAPDMAALLGAGPARWIVACESNALLSRAQARGPFCRLPHAPEGAAVRALLAHEPEAQAA